MRKMPIRSCEATVVRWRWMASEARVMGRPAALSSFPLSSKEVMRPCRCRGPIVCVSRVVAWISFDWRYHPPGAWLAFDGRSVPYAGPVEHTVTVVGVSGDSVYVFNPLMHTLCHRWGRWGHARFFLQKEAWLGIATTITC